MQSLYTSKLEGTMALRLAILLLSVHLVFGYKSGAGTGSCDDLIPRHHTPPQNSTSLYTLNFSPKTIRPGETAKITLTSPANRYFRGFLVQARRGDTNAIIGTFVIPDKDLVDTAHTITCGNIEHSSATHSTNSNKTSLDLTWKSPSDYTGNVIFRGTFVETGRVFWVNVTPPDILALAGEAIIEETIDEPKPFQEVYDGCFKTKGCFGGPPGCVHRKDCLQLVTYAYNNSKFDVEIVSATSGWASVGFSTDPSMGDDLATVCARNQSNHRINVFQSWNIGKSNEVLQDLRLGLSSMEGQYLDSYLYCRFSSTPSINIDSQRKINFLNNSYYLFLARGLMDSMTPPVKLRMHDKMPYITAGQASLMSVEEIGVASDLFIKLHGCLMVVAWIGTVSVAIFLARYFKQTWSEVTHCKQKVWFTWHRLLNILTVLLTVIGFVLIFVHLNGWSQIWKINPHPILGVITTVLAISQPIMAAFRCHPGTPKRPIFNWAHFLVGNGAHILAVITLFFAKPLSKARLPDFYMWILIAFVIFHVIVFFTMEAFTCFKGKSVHGNQIAMKDMAANGNSYHINDPNADAPGTRFRQFMLLLYSFGNVCFIIALVATIAASPVKEQ